MEQDLNQIKQILCEYQIFTIIKVQQDIFSNKDSQRKLREDLYKILKSVPNIYLKLHQKLNLQRDSVRTILKKLDYVFKTSKQQFEKILQKSSLQQLCICPRLQRILSNFQRQYQKKKQQSEGKQKTLAYLLKKQKMNISLKKLKQLLNDDNQRQMIQSEEDLDIIDDFIDFLQEQPQFEEQFWEDLNNFSECSSIKSNMSQNSLFSTTEEKESIIVCLKSLEEQQNEKKQSKVQNNFKKQLFKGNIKKKRLFNDNNIQQICSKQYFTVKKQQKLAFKTYKGNKISQIKGKKNEEQSYSSVLQYDLLKLLNQNQMVTSFETIKTQQIQYLLQIFKSFQKTNSIKISVYGSIANHLAMKNCNLNINIGCAGGCQSSKSCKLCQIQKSQKKIIHLLSQKKKLYFQFKDFLKTVKFPSHLQNSFVNGQNFELNRMKMKNSQDLIQNTYITFGDHQKVEYSKFLQDYLKSQPNKGLFNFLKLIILIFKKRKLIFNLNKMFAGSQVKKQTQQKQNQFTPYIVQNMCLFYLMKTNQLPFVQTKSKIKKKQENNQRFLLQKEKNQKQFALQTIDKNLIGFLNFFKQNGQFQRQYAKKKPICLNNFTTLQSIQWSQYCQKYHINILNPLNPCVSQKYFIQILKQSQDKQRDFYQKINWLYQQTQRKDFKVDILLQQKKIQ